MFPKLSEARALVFGRRDCCNFVCLLLVCAGGFGEDNRGMERGAMTHCIDRFGFCYAVGMLL